MHECLSKPQFPHLQIGDTAKPACFMEGTVTPEGPWGCDGADTHLLEGQTHLRPTPVVS